jgi:hypothetical protein
MSHNYKLVNFKGWHIEWLESRGAPVGGGYVTFDKRLRDGLECAFTWTTMCDGEPIACGGTIEVFPRRHGAWGYLNAATGPHMKRITSDTRWIMDNTKGRIELSVRKDFAPGHRWAKMLGFEVETPTLRAYGPEGEDHTGYVRFN